MFLFHLVTEIIENRIVLNNASEYIGPTLSTGISTNKNCLIKKYMIIVIINTAEIREEKVRKGETKRGGGVLTARVIVGL